MQVDRNITTGDSDIIFRASNDSGEDFDRRINLNRGGHLFSSSISPQISATENGDIYVVWTDRYIQLRQILDRCAIVGDIVSIGNSSALSINPQILATARGYVYVTWDDLKIQPVITVYSLIE